MEFKRSMLILIMAIFLASIAGVCASDVNDTAVASDDINQMDLSSNNEITEDNLKTSEENTTLTQANDAESDSQILSAGEGTYNDLRNEIGSGGDKNLAKSYYRYTGGDTIEITTSGVINGNGAVIDMAGSNIRAFEVSGGTVIIKNLTIQNVNYDGGSGGAIFFYVSQQDAVENCTFINNYAYYGGAVYCSEYSTCTVTNCNFIGNRASMNGGAILFDKNANVANCNFTNNNAYCGGAIYTYSGSVKNCTFTNNRVTGDSGAIYISSGSVKNCNFTGNSAKDNSGAVYLVNGEVTNCNFNTNSAGDYGGAVYLGDGTLTNCNFSGNIADSGGAVYSNWDCAVSDCNFTGNNATTGSAIYFKYAEATKSVSNSYFLNNRANVEELQITKNEINIIIVLKGKNNLLNAIYSNSDVSFTNVTYWGVTGIDNTDNCAPSRSNREAGQNIIMEIYDSDDKLVKNITSLTDENGQVTYEYLKMNNGNYSYKAYHPKDCYYTYSEKTGEFSTDFGDFNRLQRYINNAEPNSVLTLSRNYTFTPGKDENLTDGIVIDKQITVNGNGYAIDANGKARIFNITGNNVVLENITFKNAYSKYTGCAVYFSQSGKIINCNFTNNTCSNYGGAAYFTGNGDVANCNFINNTAGQMGGAIFFKEYSNVANSNFINNSASEYGGAVYFDGNGDLTNCSFVKNSALLGGAIHIYSGNVINCNFTGNNASNGSAIYFHDASGTSISHSLFLNNRADAKALDVIKNENNITIIFKGGNDILNAIDSEDNAGVTLTNVTYWGANGINNTGSISRLLSGSNREAGQNITIRIIVNDEVVLNDVEVTDENGEIVLENVKLDGSYYIIVSHGSDSYYTEAANVATNMKLYANVTDVTTHNRTVNITAKSNIPTEIISDKLLFILPNGRNITANYTSNGIWWAAHTFEAYDDYEISATYPELDNLTVKNATIRITKADSTITVNKVVFNYGDSNVTVKTEGASGITAKIDGNNVTVTGFTIPISGLNAGNHTLTVTTIADEDHNPVTKTVNITVNKADCILIVNDVELYYGESKNVTVTAEGTVNITAKIDGNNVTVTGFTIPISGLNPGTHTLTVTAVPDENHTEVTGNATITVNRLKTELTGNPITTTYDVNGYLVITLKDIYGNPLSGNTVLVDLNGVKTYTTNNNGQVKVPTKALAAKVYTARITFNGDAKYEKSSMDVKVTVKKAANPLKVKGKTLKVKFSKLKKKAVKVKVTKVVKFTKKGVGTLTYKKVKGNKKIAINKKTGKVTIKKGLKKGTYKVKMKIKANGNANYNPSAFKTITLKIKVK